MGEKPIGASIFKLKPPEFYRKGEIRGAVSKNIF